MAKSIEQRVQELEDRDEIKELTARYCWHVAHGEGEAVADLFTDDGVLDVNDAEFEAVRGREALLKFYRASVREPEAALPFIQNHIIELNGDEAHGTCAIEARFARKGASVGDGASSSAKYFSITWYRSSRDGPRRRVRAAKFRRKKNHFI